MKQFLGDKCFIIAEIGASHHQDFLTACNLVDAARYAGADAVKVQMFKPASLTANSQSEKFLIDDGPWAGYSLWELYEKASMPYEWVPALKDQAEKAGLKFVASVYDAKTLDVAELMEIEAYKVASYEATETELLKALDKTGKPVIVSTGVLSWPQIGRVCHLVKNVALLKCTSEYPAPLDEMNLRTILDMKRNFGPFVGLSDHTTGMVAPVVAVSMGARIIEKHIKIDEQGLDSSFAIHPQRFKAMVETIRAAEKCMGKVAYGGKSQIKRAMVDGKSVRIVEKDTKECSLTK
ncbi:MAG: N-acetylneuraminate synthase family protein [Planctomycetota bacterium]|jgi:sialic acid synthase SpsE